MRVRTAIAVAVALVAAKAALIVVALTAWSAIPERRWPVDHWHIELGDVAGWLAAGGTAFAAIAALYIATRDRRARQRERATADEAQANLVLVEVSPSQGFAGFDVKITNYGTRAVLDVEFETAQFEPFPNAKPILGQGAQGHIPVLDCDRDPRGFWFGLEHDGNSVITGHRDEVYGWESDNADATKVTATIRFKDADGHRWRRSNRGDAERLRAG